jgi:predicted dehydrogenase
MEEKMKKVKIGVVGCGSVSQRVYIPRVASLVDDRIDFVAVCDSVKERAEEAAAKYQPKEIYDDYKVMLSKADINAVFNLTPIFQHMPINLATLRAGKHLFSEKPMAPTVEEATLLIEEAEKRRLKLVCAPIFMLNPAIRQGGRILSEGILGKVCFAKGHVSHGGIENIEGWPTDATWFLKKGAGALFDLGIYPLTVVTGLLGPARRVTALSGIALPKRLVKGGITRGKVMETESHDNSHLLLDFGDSVFASIHGTFCVKAAKGPPFEFYGSGGVLTINHSKSTDFWLEAYVDNKESPFEGWLSSRRYPFESWRVTLPTPRDKWEDWYIDLGVDHLVECILEDKKPIACGEHNRHVIEIIVKAYEAVETGMTQDLSTSFSTERLIGEGCSS